MKAAAKNKRDKRGKFARNPIARRKTDTSDAVNSPVDVIPGHFVSEPLSQRLQMLRPWPTISGRTENLDRAIEHLEGLVAEQGMKVVRVPNPTWELNAYYDPEPNEVVMASDLYDNRPLYAFSLAHELGHRFDPHFNEFPHHHEVRKFYRYMEIIAEHTAVKCLKEHGLELDGWEGFLNSLDKRSLRRWRRSISGADIRHQIKLVELALLPYKKNPTALARRQRELDQAQKMFAVRMNDLYVYERDRIRQDRQLGIKNE